MPETIVIIIIIITLISLFIIHSIKNEKNKTSEFTNFKNKLNELGYLVNEINNGIYDLEIQSNEITFIAKLINIPEFSEIQINNKNTWEIKYGAGNTPGKVQPYRKYLKNITPFMEFTPKNNVVKIVIASPTPKKMVKYINECEIEFITPYTDVYGTRLISYKDYKIFMNPLNIKNDKE